MSRALHRLSGVQGWGTIASEINANNVVVMTCRERLFRLFDRDLPYTLRIVYNRYVGTGQFCTSQYEFYETEIITRRYATREDAVKEMQRIELKKNMVS